MMNGPDTPWELKILIIAIVIDVICLYKLLKFDPLPDTEFRNGAIIVISGIILYFAIGSNWWGMLPLTGTDPYGVTSTTQLGAIAVAICPGSLVAWIWTYLEYSIPLWKELRQSKKKDKESRK